MFVRTAPRARPSHAVEASAAARGDALSQTRPARSLAGAWKLAVAERTWSRWDFIFGTQVTLVRMSNDRSLPVEQRRNYTSVLNAAVRIGREEGVATYAPPSLSHKRARQRAHAHFRAAACKTFVVTLLASHLAARGSQRRAPSCRYWRGVFPFAQRAMLVGACQARPSVGRSRMMRRRTAGAMAGSY